MSSSRPTANGRPTVGASPNPRELPRLFALAGRSGPLWALAFATLTCGLAIVPTMLTMSAHGAGLTAFELAGSVARSRQILADWGAAGKTAAWWQLALDTPFLIGYGLLLAGACAAVARRAARTGRRRIEQIAGYVAWFGPLAAAADFAQNVCLAAILSGADAQPFPRISQVGGLVTQTLAGASVLFALGGALATRASRPSIEETP